MANKKMFMGTNQSVRSWAAANAHATNPLTNGNCRAILVGVAGDVAIKDLDGNSVTLPALVAGVVHPIHAQQIFVAGTTATGIFVGY